MKKLMIPLAAGVAAVALAACGGSANSSGSSSTPAPTASSVLKDTSGMALYTPTGESASNIRCTGACVAIWKPVQPGSAKLTGASTITRPDGTKQLVINGKPLYTFAQDTPGQVGGNGAMDAFAGKQFTWHAVSSGGSTAASAPASSGGGGYGSSGY